MIPTCRHCTLDEGIQMWGQDFSAILFIARVRDRLVGLAEVRVFGHPGPANKFKARRWRSTSTSSCGSPHLPIVDSSSMPAPLASAAA